MRAWKWLATNRPSGDAFKNWNASKDDSVDVEIVLDDNTTIALSRDNGKNTYFLSQNEKEKTFSAIKTDVPEEIMDALNMPERNIQSQHQEYFLLQDSPGVRAQKLNDLVGLSVIDTIFKNLASKIRETASAISSLKSTRDHIETELEKYDNLDAVKKLLDSIEEKEGKASEISSSLNDLRKNVTTLKEIKESREEDIQWIALEPQCEAIQTKITALKEYQEKRKALQSTINDLESIRSSKVETVGKKNKAKREYISLLEQNKICPTCFSAINDDRMLEIVGGLE